MIGNDIVDLKYAAIESNWKRPRFLNKVFSEEEQLLISNSDNGHQMVWLLWSMKESAYKIYVQQFGVRFFNPKKLRCELISLKQGFVSIENKVYFTNTTLTKDFIYTVAKSQETGKNLNDIFKIQNENVSYKSQSDITKKKLLNIFSELKNSATSDMEIRKNLAGIPRLYCNTNEENISFSITHHGRYGGYAISV